MNNSNLSLDVSANGPGLQIEIFLDNILLFVGEPTQDINKFSFSFDDSHEIPHRLCIKLSGKLPDHTKIDSDNNIVYDRVVKISNVRFDDIDLGHVFFEKCTYTHDFNGTKDETTTKFYGVMGCNGTVEFEFSSPIYLWLLENM